MINFESVHTKPQILSSVQVYSNEIKTFNIIHLAIKHYFIGFHQLEQIRHINDPTRSMSRSP